MKEFQKFCYPKNHVLPSYTFYQRFIKNTFPIKGRPIVSANDCPTEKISAFVDTFLNPIVQKSKSYVKDTTDFLNLIKSIKIEHDYLIIGPLDVTSLYTQIPHNEGLEAISKALNKYRSHSQNPKNESIVELMKLVLTCNNFQFNKINYLQIQGTAMGSKSAPSYSGCFMTDLEERMLEAYPLKPLIWRRYIDDIYFHWQHGEEELKKWLVHLNNFHAKIKFTSEWSYDSVTFLDTRISINRQEKCLKSDLFIKPTDSNSYCT